MFIYHPPPRETLGIINHFLDYSDLEGAVFRITILFSFY
jgi:hypothetical protein